MDKKTHEIHKNLNSTKITTHIWYKAFLLLAAMCDTCCRDLLLLGSWKIETFSNLTVMSMLIVVTSNFLDWKLHSHWSGHGIQVRVCKQWTELLE